MPSTPTPHVLHSLVIESVRCFERLELEFVRPHDPDAGQWTILLGENGTGKTTILRALALAKADPHVILSLLSALQSDWQRRPTAPATVTMKSSKGTANFEFRGRVVTGSFAQPGFVVAYGAGRGSALGGPDRAVRLDGDQDAFATLFQSGSLIHAETWLKQLELGAFKDGESGRAFRDAVVSTLVALLPGVYALDIETDGVFVEGDAVGRTSLSGLSDGFLTTLGWVVDLVARWADYAERNSIELTSDFSKEMTGLVLLDELDLHLHPRWQKQIIGQLREAFPRLSFVVTTHNPMTLHGARDGEVHVLHRDHDGIRVQQIDIPPGTDADDLLTGRWFDLDSTLDADTLEVMATYQEKLVAGANRKTLTEMEDTLRTRLGSFADTRADRLAHQLVAETQQHSTKPLGDDDIKSLKLAMAKRLQALK